MMEDLIIVNAVTVAAELKGVLFNRLPARRVTSTVWYTVALPVGTWTETVVRRPFYQLYYHHIPGFCRVCEARYYNFRNRSYYMSTLNVC